MNNFIELKKQKYVLKQKYVQSHVTVKEMQIKASLQYYIFTRLQTSAVGRDENGDSH